MESRLKNSETKNRLKEDYKESQDFIYKTILLNSAILGTSISLVSGNFLSSQINLSFLKIGWIFFLLSILTGFYLIELNQKFETFRTYLEMLSATDLENIEIEDKNDNNLLSEKSVALAFLHAKRSINPPRLSKKGEEKINTYKEKFLSWELIKNPESVYSTKDIKIIKRTEIEFRTLSILPFIFLIIGILT